MAEAVAPSPSEVRISTQPEGVSSPDGRVLIWTVGTGPDQQHVGVDPAIFIRPLRHDRAFEAEVIRSARTQLEFLPKLVPGGRFLTFESRPYDRHTESPQSVQEYSPEEQATLAIASALENLHGHSQVRLPDKGDENNAEDLRLTRDHALTITPVNKDGKVLVVDRRTEIRKEGPVRKIMAGSKVKGMRHESEMTQHITEIKFIPESEAQRLRLHQREMVMAQPGLVR